MNKSIYRLMLVMLMGIIGTINSSALTYISDVAVASETSFAAAEKDLTSAGYTVLTSYKYGSGSGDLDVGVNCGYYSLIGYKTSTNPADAITDLIFETNNYDTGTYTIDDLTYSKANAYGRGYVGHQSYAHYYLYYSKSRKDGEQTFLYNIQISDNGASSRSELVKGYNGTSVNSSNGQDLNANCGGTTGHYIYIYMAKQTHTHSQNSFVYNATNHWYKCDCGYEYSELSHTLTYKDNGDGTHSYYCTICGYVKSTENHTIAYTDNGDGTHTATCSICGHTESAAHTIAYTDNGDGTHTATCSICGHTESATHSLTYTNNGDGTHTANCSICGHTESAAHTIDYTVNGDGTHTANCSICGYTESAAHTIVYEENNEETHNEYCTVCEYVINTPCHNFLITKNDDGTFLMNCPTCSYKNFASYIYGDINCDGKVDINDVALLVKVLKGDATATPQCNVHSDDDDINLNDLEAIKEIIFGNRGITFEASPPMEDIEQGGDSNDGDDVPKTADVKARR